MRARLASLSVAVVAAALSLTALSCKPKDRGDEKVKDGDPLRFGDDGAGAKNEYDVAVDPRAELMAIVFRLAKAPPYVDAKGPYADDVDQHFGGFADHEAVVAARALRKTNGISYDAPVELAVHLDRDLQPIVPLDPLPADLGVRWKGVDFDDFLGKLRRFAKETRFDEFLARHAEQHHAVERKFLAFAQKEPVVDWYEHAFGPRSHATYHLAPSALTASYNFGVRAKDAAGGEALTILLAYSTSDGAPSFTLGDVALEMMAHETGHSFVNPIVDEHWDELEPSSEAAFALKKAAMQKLAYGTPNIMTREAVNRAVVLLFLSDRSSAGHRDATMKAEVDRGFAWTPELTRALADARRKNDGKLRVEDVVQTTRAALRAWADAHGG